MPTSDFNVGRDVQFTFFDNNAQAIVSFDIVVGFDKKQESAEVKVKGIDGICRYAYLPDGWKGTLEIDRADRTADDYFARLEDMYYEGKTVLNAQITETINERDGTISQYRYERVVAKLSDAGKAEGDKPIKMKIDWAASRRRIVK